MQVRNRKTSEDQHALLSDLTAVRSVTTPTHMPPFAFILNRGFLSVCLSLSLSGRE